MTIGELKAAIDATGLPDDAVVLVFETACGWFKCEAVERTTEDQAAALFGGTIGPRYLITIECSDDPIRHGGAPR